MNNITHEWNSIIPNKMIISKDAKVFPLSFEEWLENTIPDDKHEQFVSSFFELSKTVTLDQYPEVRREFEEWYRSILSYNNKNGSPFVKPMRILWFYEQLVQKSLERIRELEQVDKT